MIRCRGLNLMLQFSQTPNKTTRDYLISLSQYQRILLKVAYEVFVSHSQATTLYEVNF